MSNSFSNAEITELLKKLLQEQEILQKEIVDLRRQVKTLQKREDIQQSFEAPQQVNPPAPAPQPLPATPAVQAQPIPPVPAPAQLPLVEEEVKAQVSAPVASERPASSKKSSKGSSIEAIIGGQVTNKIGIIILLLGLGYFVKYAFDQDLVGPAGRIVVGYLSAGLLGGIAWRLHKRFTNFGAVMTSGAMAIAYFTTYFGWSLYSLYPLPVAFGLMLLLIAGTVYLARLYQREVIGVLATLGAYAIPLLLDTGSERYDMLFGYMALINLSMVVLSFRYDWRWMRRLALYFTWIVCLIWYGASYDASKQWILHSFYSLFFVEFTLLLIGLGLRKQEKLGVEEVIYLLVNSFLFFTIGLAALVDAETWEYLPGFYALAYAFFHFALFGLLHLRKQQGSTLSYVLVGLGITFLTVAIPVQLEGSWISVLWILEAVLLFRIGILRKEPYYLFAGSTLLLLSITSQLTDWVKVFLDKPLPSPFLNLTFASGLLILAGMSMTIYWFRQEKIRLNRTWQIVLFLITTVFGYWVFGQEIVLYYAGLGESTDPVWLLTAILTYSLLYASVVLLLNQVVMQVKELSYVSGLLQLLFLTVVLSLTLSLDAYEKVGARQELALFWWRMGIWLLLVAKGWYEYLYNKRQGLWPQVLLKMQMLQMHLMLVLFGSSLLYQVKALAALEQGYFLASLSVFWAIYGLALVGTGLWRSQALWRIAGISLLAVTVLKLFLFDLSAMATPGKILVFVLLGVFLLLISYLYQKYKHLAERDAP